jgi:hypothetical protein
MLLLQDSAWISAFRFAPVVKSVGRVGQSVSVCGSLCLFSLLRHEPFIGQCLWREQPGRILPCYESSVSCAVWRYLAYRVSTCGRCSTCAEAQVWRAECFAITAALVRLHA